MEDQPKYGVPYSRMKVVLEFMQIDTEVDFEFAKGFLSKGIKSRIDVNCLYGLPLLHYAQNNGFPLETWDEYCQLHRKREMAGK